MPKPYIFSQNTSTAYLRTHQWLGERDKSYLSFRYKDIRQKLTEETLASAAGQFRALFPSHYFKVQHLLHTVITLEKLATWLAYDPVICILDVGCGAGAGSTAFIDTLTLLYQSKLLTHPVNIYCIGIDPNPHALGVYNKMLTHVSELLQDKTIGLHHQVIPGGFPSVTTQIAQNLQNIATKWNRPNLPHLFVMQLNVVSPFKQNYDTQTADLEILQQYGIEPSVYGKDRDFGEKEAQAYLQIFTTARVDHMHIFTIGTRNYQLDERVAEMGSATCKVFEQNTHKITVQGEGEQSIKFYNPKGSLHEARVEPYHTHFHSHILIVTNDQLRGDREWQEVIELYNLKLAWVRTRREILREAFIDEVEIRLFEKDLEGNLRLLQRQLMAYAEDVARHDDYVAYKVPKNASQTRPRGLSRFEEEILSVAIIQQLGQTDSRTRSNSYAYRISGQSRGRDTEYLYAPWLSAFGKYQEDARNSAQRYADGTVIKTDIRSFYTRILHKQLEEATREIVQSERLRWLIKLLLSKKIDGSELDQGLVQGGIASGFFANLYLKPIDVLLGAENEWNAKLFRYLDDMIIVVPSQEDGTSSNEAAQTILSILEDSLSTLGLEINKGKTAILTTSDFLEQTQPDSDIDILSKKFDLLTTKLWVLDDKLRQKFIQWREDDNLWWHWIKQYQLCLESINIFTAPRFLSRRIFKYLFHETRRKKDLVNEMELKFPKIPSSTQKNEFSKWSQSFATENQAWWNQLGELHEQLSSMFFESMRALRSDLEPLKEQVYLRRLRFSLNRLRQIGFGTTTEEILILLKQEPWNIRELLGVIKDLAKQQFDNVIVELISFYKASDKEMAEYMRVCLLNSLNELQLDKSHWKTIISFAQNGSPIERLTAVEVWLKLSTTPEFPNYKEAAQKIFKSLKNSTFTSRVKKGYLLLFQEYDILNPIGPTHDPLLQRVAQLNDSVATLFEYIEPVDIMEYYSGLREEDGDWRY